MEQFAKIPLKLQERVLILIAPSILMIVIMVVAAYRRKNAEGVIEEKPSMLQKAGALIALIALFLVWGGVVYWIYFSNN